MNQQYNKNQLETLLGNQYSQVRIQRYEPYGDRDGRK